jgi:hypothetical protein
MPTPSPDRAALARERLAAKRRRAPNLRRRVVAGALATFALAWGVIAFSGPMGAEPTTAATATTGTTASAAATTDQSSASTDDDPVTTAQS